jgi:acetyl-CoA carboxylase biotin carboxyl carrier protein
MKSPDEFSSPPAFDFQDLLQLVELMKSTTQFSEMRLRAKGIELELRRGPAPATGNPATAAAAPAAQTAAARPEPAPIAASVPAAPLPPSTTRAARSDVEGQTLVNAPMVGTVYMAPEPGAPPFVTLGQAVEPDTQICIVEVMKLMNSVTAGCRGAVSEILVGDGEAVEYGQALFVITPA